ncbi:hypothetical protein [Fodinicurvata sediminis]|uniref:hypothetical protein n=1 Tax=Fodinicurvata sediminis TaxID=1121832 RepID=UPI0003B702E7|nr:hypothetical protein [Fodinicurvata sediminis]
MTDRQDSPFHPTEAPPKGGTTVAFATPREAERYRVLRTGYGQDLHNALERMLHQLNLVQDDIAQGHCTLPAFDINRLRQDVAQLLCEAEASFRQMKGSDHEQR